MIQFRPMTEEEFSRFHHESVHRFLDDLAEMSGSGRDEALASSKQIFGEILPDGMRTPGHQFLTILAPNGSPAGVLWIGNRRGKFEDYYLFDIWIDPSFQGRGIGTAAVSYFESEARHLGKKRTSLHVFGHNHRARKLYERLGYGSVSITMQKNL